MRAVYGPHFRWGRRLSALERLRRWLARRFS